jgi:hypothetical protein
MSHLAKISREEDSHIQRTNLPRLLTRFELGGDQPDFVDSRATHDVNNASDVLEHGFVIAFNEGDFCGTVL